MLSSTRIGQEGPRDQNIANHGSHPAVLFSTLLCQSDRRTPDAVSEKTILNVRPYEYESLIPQFMLALLHDSVRASVHVRVIKGRHFAMYTNPTAAADVNHRIYGKGV